MNRSCSRVYLFAWLLALTSPSGAMPRGDQQNSVSDPKMAFVPPPGRLAPVRLVDAIEGQVLFCPPNTRTMYPASGIGVALFDGTNRIVALTSSGDKGQFHFPPIALGKYTLVASRSGVKPVAIPVLFETPVKAVNVQPALMLKLRSLEDPAASRAAVIRDRALRNELLMRVSLDQQVRNEMIQHGADHPDAAIIDKMKKIDGDNLVWMQQTLSKYRWPSVGLVGADGAEAAFLIAQHAPLEFQVKVLPSVRNAYRSGDLTGQDYALLQDRVLVRQGKKQIFGTQTLPFDKWQGHEPVFSPIEDEANVDTRRAEVGLPTLAEYRRVLTRAYFPTDPVKP